MAEKNINSVDALNPMTVDANDRILVSDNSASNNGALKRATPDAVSKYAVETYTTTLGGVNNKTVQSAINDLNSKTYSLSGGTQLQANVDLDTLLPGNYYAYSTIAVQHGPFSDICGIVKVEHSAGTDDKYLRQTYRRYNNDAIYERIKDGNTWKDWIKLPARAEVDALNSNITIDFSSYHTKIPNGSDFNSYTTPGVYYVESDASGATMINTPRKASGKLIVMARHSAGYYAQYFYPSTSNFTRYVRSYGGGSWNAWITEEISYENAGRRQYSLGSISSSSTATFEELGLTKYQYGAYFVVLRTDGAADGTWAGIVRHNSAGYQISEFYKGESGYTPYVTTDGIIKTIDSAAIPCYGLVFPINVWGSLLS